MTSFKAYLIESVENKTKAGFVEHSITQLDPGEVLIKVAYSSINYKDALAATGAGKIIRRFPCIGGIDLSGVVLESGDDRFKRDDKVVVAGYELGVSHHGGYAEYARVPADWVVHLSQALSLHDAAAYGVAGFTAAYSILRLQANGLQPKSGPVIVTGATGGVGSIAVALLAKLGYNVTALTGKETQQDYLRRLGAKQILLRHQLEMGKKPLEKALWAGAVDTVGGEPLAWLTRTMQTGASISACGLTAGIELNTTVMPFILRGVSLLGIDSVSCPIKSEMWKKLAGEMNISSLFPDIVHDISFDQLPTMFDAFLKGAITGRVVVKISES